MFDIDDVYREYAETVFKFLLSLCNDEDTAEELTQETFYRAIKSSHRYDGTCKVSTWLCQIAKYLWYQEIDKRKRRGTSMLTDDIVSNQFDPEEELCLIEDKMQLIKAVHILDETAKEIVLYASQSIFFKEIGEIFNKMKTGKVTFNVPNKN